MHVELPSLRPDGVTHNWVEMRDKTRPLDQPAVQEVAYKTRIEVRPDGTEVRDVTTGGADSRMRFALLARVITAWSFDGVPVPSQNIAAPDEVIDSVFTDEDDWDAICDAVEPMLERLTRQRPKPAEKTASA